MRDAGFGDLPQLVEAAGLDDGEDVAFAVAKAFTVGRGFCRVGEQVATADDGGEFGDSGVVCCHGFSFVILDGVLPPRHSSGCRAAAPAMKLFTYTSSARLYVNVSGRRNR